MPNQIEENTKKTRVHKLLQLSKELEINYMNKFIGKSIEFLSEVYNNGFLVGHTGYYLLIKCKSDKAILNKDLYVTITNVEYPYCIATLQDINKLN